MRIYIIRHADPDYANRTITPEGHLEAKALSKRLASQGLDFIYSSPLGRAIHTAQYTARLLEMDYQIEDWTKEASLMIEEPSKGKISAWDLDGEIIRGEMPATTYENWFHQPPFDAPMFREYFDVLVKQFDRFLASHGYVREGRRYRIVETNQHQIALFCHGGFGLIWISHLLELPVPIVWSSFFLAPSSVTTILFDERSNQWATPRCIGLADVSHLYQAGLDVQPSGIKANFY